MFNGEEVFLLRQTDDDFAISCKNEATAIAIFDIIGKKLQLRNKDSPPFDYFGQLIDFNGVEVNQFQEYIGMPCSGFIDRIVRSHGWDKDLTFGNTTDCPTSPLADNCIHQLHESFIGTEGGGFKEGTKQHKDLEDEMGFAYRTVLGELMFAYVCCRLDIAYAVTTLSKFSTCLTRLHYQYLVGVVKYLHRTRHWGSDTIVPVNHPNITHAYYLVTTLIFHLLYLTSSKLSHQLIQLFSLVLLMLPMPTIHENADQPPDTL